MTAAQLLVTIVCGLGGLGLAFRGTYWLGGRNALRELAGEQIALEAAAILAAADDDDGGGGVEMATPLHDC